MTYAVYGRRSHKMKQTQTHAWSLVGEEAVAVSCTSAVPGQRENTETVAKQKQLPSAGLDSMRGAHAHKIT